MRRIHQVSLSLVLAMIPQACHHDDATAPQGLQATLEDQNASGSRIAFTRNLGGVENIYVMNPDGSDQVQVTTNGAFQPSWSPDGRRIAFTREKRVGAEKHWYIFVMNADGSDQTELTGTGYQGWGHPTWSPDGQQIAFSRFAWRIDVSNTDGTGGRALVGPDTAPGGDDPSWSPDGRRIAFHNQEIYVVNADDGSARVRLTNNTAWDGEPSWSPDGRQIAFTRGFNSGDIYVMNADGSSEVRLTDHPGDDRSPTWSPDGRRIAFASNRDGNYEIYMMNADGSAQTRVTNDPAADVEPSWGVAAPPTDPRAPQLAADAFNRPDETPIAGNWTSGPGDFADIQLFGNGVHSVSPGVDGAAYYHAVAWPADQWSEVKLGNLGPEQGGPAVRLSASAVTGYVFAVNDWGASYFIAKGIEGSTPILTSGTYRFWAGDVLRLEVQGQTLRAYVNGRLLASVVDADIPAGHAGIWIYHHAAVGLRFDNWVGGEFASGPAPAPPAAPTDLAATTVSASQINLGWTDNATTESGFRIERCAGAGCSGFAEIATVGANVVSYQNTALTGSTSYSYRVRAYNPDGTSAYSNTATATTAPSGSASRTQTDRPDEASGNQIHVFYVLPSDGVDRGLDTTGALANSVGSFQNWLAGQTSGRKLRLDTYDGGTLDITFWRLGRSDETIRSYGLSVRDTIEKDLVAAGFATVTKIYAVYYDGGATNVCGGAAWPPQLPGRVAAIYLRGTFTNGAPPCGSNPFASSPTAPPGYLEYAMLHEILQPMGIVSPGAPNHNQARRAHVDTDPADLMYAGDQAWRPSVLDVNWSNYYNPGGLPAGLYNLATSPFLLPGPALVPPAAPASLAAAAVSTSRIDLNWTDNATNEAGFRIERCTGTGCSWFVEIATVGPNVVSYQNTGLAASTSYSYRVRAYIGGGASTYSNTVTAATTAPPTASDAFDRANETPMGGNWTSGAGNFGDLQIVANGVQGVTAGVDAAAYYNAVVWPDDQWSEVQLKSLGAEQGGPAVRLSATAVTGYVLAIDNNGASYFIAKGIDGSTPILTSGAHAFAVGDVLRLEVEGTTLRAYVNGTLLASVVDADIPSGSPGIWIYDHQGGLTVDNWAGAGFAPGPVPAPPTNLTGGRLSASRINVGWRDNATNEDGFRIERCTGAGCSAFSEIVIVGRNVVSYPDTGLTASTTYSYRVRAYNENGASPYSNVVTVTTAPPPQWPATPTNLSANAASPNQIDLIWTDNATNEDGFRIMRCTGAGCSDITEIATVAPNVVSYQNTGLAASTSYSYRVQAYSFEHGTSDFSNTATATTSGTPPPPAPGPLATDAFNRANENPIAGTWTSGAGAAGDLQVLNNGVQAVSNSTNNTAFWNALTWPADQWSEVTIRTLSSTGNNGVGVRMHATTATYYTALVLADGSLQVWRSIDHSFTLILAAGGAGTVVAGDRVRLEVQGTTLRVYRNGVLRGSVEDTQIATGSAGIGQDETSGALDDWAGGGVTPGPAGAQAVVRQ